MAAVRQEEFPTVGTRGPGNFDNLDALVTADAVVDDLLLCIDEILSSEDEADPDQRGEAELMPTVALLIAAMSESGDCPVEPDEARHWRDAYVLRFVARGRTLFPEAAAFDQRLGVILQTFQRLEVLACRFHPDLAADPQRAPS